MKHPIIIHKRPRLRNPNLIIGWTDAGLVGISAVEYLANHLKAEEFGEIEPYDFSLLPHSVIRKGVLQKIEYPKNSFYYWKNRQATNDLILMSGKLPAIKHYEMANLILNVAELFDVNRIYTVGGIRANIAHNARTRIFGIINNPRLARHLKHEDVDSGRDYHGPTSMNSLISGLAQQRNIDTISLWGRVPDYISELPNPQICQAVLRVLSRMIGLDINFGEIESESRYANRQIDRLVNYLRHQDPSLDRHIERLEKGLDTETTEEDRQKIFGEIEEFLKGQGRRPKNDQIDE